MITSNGGGATAAISVPENTLAVTTVTATDANPGDTLSYSISGTDAALFDIDSVTGALTFKDLPDFEIPVDANTDNDYEVTVTVSDGNGGSDTQDITVTVTQVADSGVAVWSNTTDDSTEQRLGRQQLRHDQRHRYAEQPLPHHAGRGCANP